jgi:hypothetical protein
MKGGFAGASPLLQAFFGNRRTLAMRISPFHAGAALLVAAFGSTPAGAQVAEASGTVTLKQDDGAQLPAAGAVVDIYRTDIKAAYQVKTDNQGRYFHAGLPLVGTYTMVFSAPGARPSAMQGCRIRSSQKLDAILEPGDGRRPSLDEVRAAGASPCVVGAGRLLVEGSDGTTQTASPALFAEVPKTDLAALFDGGFVDQTVLESRAILAARPNDYEASLYLGLALHLSNHKPRFQEAADHLRRFVDMAPDTDGRKATAKASLDRLESLGVVAFVPPPPKPTRRRP